MEHRFPPVADAGQQVPIDKNGIIPAAVLSAKEIIVNSVFSAGQTHLNL
jgi:hypothetical protein